MKFKLFVLPLVLALTLTICAMEEQDHSKWHDAATLINFGKSHEFRKDYKGAASFYKKAFEVDCNAIAGYYYASLIYKHEAEFESETQLADYLHYLTPIVNEARNPVVYERNPVFLHIANTALNLYATLFHDYGSVEDLVRFGLPALEIASKQGCAIASAQLGILYRYGLYVEKNLEKAQQYFEEVLNSEPIPGNLAAKAYMYQRGDGVAKDEEKAKELIAEALLQLPEARERLELLTEKENRQQHDLTGEPDGKKQLTDKKKRRRGRGFGARKPKAKLPEQIEEEYEPIQICSILDTLRVQREIPKSFPYKTIVQKCNALSHPVDGSSIEINPNKQVIFINDPKFNKRFVFPFDEGELHHDIELAPFKYDERIGQQLDTPGGNADPHKFGIAVDYLLQMFGVLDPFKNKKREDRLLHPAQLIKPFHQKGQFEYTFFKTRMGYNLYHRLFKKLPAIKKQS